MANSVTTTAIVLFSLLWVSRADYWPGDAQFQTICRTIIDEVNANTIRRRGLGSNGQIEVHETLTQEQLCDRLTVQQSLKNRNFLGGSIITSDECMDAFQSPKLYRPVDWNQWRGRHCGEWQQTSSYGGEDVGLAERDNALWHYAGQYVKGGDVFYRQNVQFFGRHSCCEDGWNESGGSVSSSSYLANS